jgi:hypothetical protein
MERNRNMTVRTVYLYVATLVGLGLLISGGVQAFELMLKATVLTQADAEDQLWARQPPAPYMLDTARGLEQVDELTPEQKAQVTQWLEDYQAWTDQQQQLDVVAARRERQASTALALVFVGFPVYLYHWLTIRKETRRASAGNDSND